MNQKKKFQPTLSTAFPTKYHETKTLMFIIKKTLKSTMEKSSYPHLTTANATATVHIRCQISEDTSAISLQQGPHSSPLTCLPLSSFFLLLFLHESLCSWGHYLWFT